MRDIDRHDVKETLQRLIKRLPIRRFRAGLIYILAAQVNRMELEIQLANGRQNKNNEKVVSHSDQQESIKNGRQTTLSKKTLISPKRGPWKVFIM